MIVDTKNLRAAEAALREMDGEEPKLPKKQRMGQLLNEKGLSLPNIADNLSMISRCAEKEDLRLKANELALKIHGVLTDEEGPRNPVFNIQIVGDANLGFLRP